MSRGASAAHAVPSETGDEKHKDGGPEPEPQADDTNASALILTNLNPRIQGSLREAAGGGVGQRSATQGSLSGGARRPGASFKPTSTPRTAGNPNLTTSGDPLLASADVHMAEDSDNDVDSADDDSDDGGRAHGESMSTESSEGSRRGQPQHTSLPRSAAFLRVHTSTHPMLPSSSVPPAGSMYVMGYPGVGSSPMGMGTISMFGVPGPESADGSTDGSPSSQRSHGRPPCHPAAFSTAAAMGTIPPSPHHMMEPGGGGGRGGSGGGGGESMPPWAWAHAASSAEYHRRPHPQFPPTFRGATVIPAHPSVVFAGSPHGGPPLGYYTAFPHGQATMYTSSPNAEASASHHRRESSLKRSRDLTAEEQQSTASTEGAPSMWYWTTSMPSTKRRRDRPGPEYDSEHFYRLQQQQQQQQWRLMHGAMHPAQRDPRSSVMSLSPMARYRPVHCQSSSHEDSTFAPEEQPHPKDEERDAQGEGAKDRPLASTQREALSNLKTIGEAASTPPITSSSSSTPAPTPTPFTTIATAPTGIGALDDADAKPMPRPQSAYTDERLCINPQCNAPATPRTNYCRKHGVGRRCQAPNCVKSARSGAIYCTSHGGGRRCIVEGCTTSAAGSTHLCKRHGGGKRCSVDGCKKSAQGKTNRCSAHGGGKRCTAPGCDKSAQGRTALCKGHGGGKRCTHPNCTKSAAGKTPFCIAHGGGKRCAVSGCTKSAQGRTEFCVGHGGGKRCIVLGCTRGARSRSKFCKRHGGGRPCSTKDCARTANDHTAYCDEHMQAQRSAPLPVSVSHAPPMALATPHTQGAR